VVWERFHSSRKKDYPCVDKSTEITLSSRPDGREGKGNSRGRQDGQVAKRNEQQETGRKWKGRDRTGQDWKGAEKRGERGTELDGKKVERREWRGEDR
jgi:hypothetical protein